MKDGRRNARDGPDVRGDRFIVRKKIGLCDGSQDPGEGLCNENRLSTGFWSGRRDCRGVETIEMQPEDQHVFRRTTKRHGSEPLQSEGPAVVLFFEGLGRSSRGDVFQHVQLQFLLVGSDIASPGRSPGARVVRRCRQDSPVTFGQ